MSARSARNSVHLRRRLPRAFILAAMAGLVPAPGAAELARRDDLGALLQDYRALQPATTGLRIGERSVRIGHLEIDFEEGNLFALRSARGETLGFYFFGRGRYTYRSEDLADRQVIERNVARETQSPIYYNYAVRDRFDRLVLFSAKPILEGIAPVGEPGQAGAPGEGAGSGVTALGEDAAGGFRKIWRRIGLSYLAADHLAAEARLNGGDRQYIYAEMEGGREIAGYTLDRIANFEEQLFLFRTIQGFDVRFTRPLSDQPVDGGASTHVAPIVLRDADLEMSTADNRTASIGADLTLRTQEEGLRVLRFELLNNRDSRSFNWASEKNRLVVDRVATASGTSLPFSHRYHELLVQMPEPLRSDQEFHLKFEAHGDILTAMDGERHDNYFDLMGSPWFPDPAGGSRGGFTFSLKIRTRGPFVPVASGEVVGLRKDGDSYELETRSLRPARVIALFAGKYKSREERLEGRTIRVHAYAMALQRTMDKLPRVAHQFLRFYEQTLGPYPFGDLDIVEVPQNYDLTDPTWTAFGIAPAGLILLTSEAFNARKSLGASIMSQGVNHRLAHEIAHQWFPHLAYPATARDHWLSESFAEYLSGLALAASNPDAREATTFPQLFSGWQQAARSCRDAGPIEMASLLGGVDAWQDRTCLLYNRGPLVLHMLRAMAGNDRFVAILRRLIEKGAGGPVTTDDFRRAAEAVLQVDLGWFFDDWYRKGGIPEIRVDYKVQRDGAGRPVLTGRVEQADGAAFRRILTPIVLEFDGGRREVRLVLQEQPVQEFSFELTEEPKKISADPGKNNLAIYR